VIRDLLNALAHLEDDTTLVIVCDHCRRFLGTKPGRGTKGVTGGICDECLRRAEQEWEEEKLAEVSDAR